MYDNKFVLYLYFCDNNPKCNDQRAYHFAYDKNDWDYLVSVLKSYDILLERELLPTEGRANVPCNARERLAFTMPKQIIDRKKALRLSPVQNSIIPYVPIPYTRIKRRNTVCRIMNRRSTY